MNRKQSFLHGWAGCFDLPTQHIDQGCANTIALGVRPEHQQREVMLDELIAQIQAVSD